MTFYDLAIAERAARERYYELLREADIERMLRTQVPMRPKRPLRSSTFRRPRGFWRAPRLRFRPQPRLQPQPHPVGRE